MHMGHFRAWGSTPIRHPRPPLSPLRGRGALRTLPARRFARGQAVSMRAAGACSFTVALRVVSLSAVRRNTCGPIRLSIRLASTQPAAGAAGPLVRSGLNFGSGSA